MNRPKKKKVYGQRNKGGRGVDWGGGAGVSAKEQCRAHFFKVNAKNRKRERVPGGRAGVVVEENVGSFGITSLKRRRNEPKCKDGLSKMR